MVCFRFFGMRAQKYNFFFYCNIIIEKNFPF